MSIRELEVLPSPNGSNGRDTGGRFAKGNAGGPGNPYARKSAQVRSLMIDTVSTDDLQEIIRKLVGMAKAGDIAAAKLILDRTAGRVADPVDPDWVDIEGRKIEKINESDRKAEIRKAEWEAQLKAMSSEDGDEDDDFDVDED